MGIIVSIAFLILAAFSPSARNSEVIKAAYCITSAIFALSGSVTITWTRFINALKIFLEEVKNEYKKEFSNSETETEEVQS